MSTPNEVVELTERQTKEAGATIAVPQAPFLIRLLIILYALSYMGIAMYMVVDSWVLGQGTLKRVLGLPMDHVLPPIFVSAVFAVLGAVLGAGALDIVSFHRYVSVKRDFQSPHVWGYFCGPWLAAVLGLVVFALLQSGLLVFSGSKSPESQSDVSNLGYLAVGFLSGFGWLQATERIREIVSRFFAPGSKAGGAQQQPLPAPLVAGSKGDGTNSTPETNGVEPVKTGDPRS